MARLFMPYTYAAEYPFAFEDTVPPPVLMHGRELPTTTCSRLDPNADHWSFIDDWNYSHSIPPLDEYLETSNAFDVPSDYRFDEMNPSISTVKDLQASPPFGPDASEEDLSRSQNQYSPSSAISGSSWSSFGADDDRSMDIGPDHSLYANAGVGPISLAYQSVCFDEAPNFPMPEDVKHIRMNELQCFQDPQPLVVYGSDDFTWKNEYRPETRFANNQVVRSAYRLHPASEHVEQSCQISPLVVMTPTVPGMVLTDDEDPEINDDRTIDEVDDSRVSDYDAAQLDDDTEYSPRAVSNRRKQKSQTSATSPGTRRSKVDRKASRSKAHNRCKSCSYVGPTKLLLSKHTTSVHIRPFVCAFAFAGCIAKFGSKNEWKRHVSSQHLALNHWCCTIGSCGRSSTKKKASTCQHGSIFNRKDLFTQHLVRMHAPDEFKNQRSRDHVWEGQVKAYQDTSRREVRQPPTKTQCPVKGCGEAFTGPNCWDNRMEHVGKHVETNTSGAELEMLIDEDLVRWAVETKVIERQKNGWSLSATTDVIGRLNVDEDAECEDE